ncbi:MAG: mechanosensitive ion channel family protein, partial [Acinetobacter sp.]
MNFLSVFSNIQNWIDQFPWLDMLVALAILLVTAYIANFIAKQIIVRGIQKILHRVKSLHYDAFAQHSIIRRISNIVPAIVVMNGITTIPHLSSKLVAFIQMGAQAFIFLTIALAISQTLNIFNLVYQKHPNSKNKPIKGYLQLLKIMLFVVCTLMIL